MKLKEYLPLMLTAFLFVVGLTRYNDESIEKDYYKGVVVTLNKGDTCFDLIEIQNNIDGGIAIGSKITFNHELFPSLSINDVVYFKIKSYKKWTGFSTINCLFPTYVGIIEIINQ